jgi:methyl-accepting chemotaxis protein
MATGSLDTGRAYADVGDSHGAGPSADERQGNRKGLVGWYDNLPVQAKGMVAFIVIFATMFAQSAFAYRTSLAVEQANAALAHTEAVIDTADEARASLITMEAGLRTFEVSGKEEHLAPYNQARVDLQASLRELRELSAGSPDQLRRWDDLERRIATWQREIAEPGIALRRDVLAGRAAYDDVVRFVGGDQGRQQADAMLGIFAEAHAAEDRVHDQRRAESSAAEARLRQVIIFGSLGTLIFGMVVAIGISKVAAQPMQQLARAARAIAEGRQDQQVHFRSRDETGQLADAFRAMIVYQNRMALAADAIARGDLTGEVRPQSHRDVLGNAFARMTENLRGLVGELQAGTHNLSSAGSEILAASAQQAAGATEQSAAIAETTATVDEVRSSAEQTVLMAQVVTETAAQANRVADDGVAAVGEATAVMAEIRERVQSIAENILALAEQGQQIGEIIATVNDLADQSNLLALNAAIEASRAGEQGKGFAVVAQEIRTLAEGSKAATAQVRTILSDIQRATNAAVMATEQGTKGAEAGIRTIDRAGRTIDELAEAIRQAAGSAAQITASVRQHAVGMEQIAVAMGDINGATSQSLVAVGDTRQAAENLHDLAGSLTGLVAQYAR